MADGKLLIATVGLPRSGKTTWCLAFARDHGAPVVCPDAVRLAVHGRRFVARAEPFVWATAKAMAAALFLAGHDVVLVDATNTTRKRRDEWKSPDWQAVFHVLDAPKEECLRRAEGDAEILPVIERMAAQWEPLGDDEPCVTPLGATGGFPDGSCGPAPEADEGELRLAVAADRRAGLVRVEFGKPVAWLAVRKAEALELSERLRFHAGKLP